MAKLLLFGSPSFAVRCFERIVEDRRYEITAVVTQTDKPAGRGQRLQPPPVKEFAAAHGLRVFQPDTLRRLDDSESELGNFLRREGPFDAFVVVAYGKIIPEPLLALPRRGIINVHASLLPRWRGACPIQWTIFSGDSRTGVCLMRIEKGLDTGPVFAVEEIPLTGAEDFGALYKQLAETGAGLLKRRLPAILDGTLQAEPQRSEGVTHAEKWTADHAKIRWEEPAEITVRRIRASAPEPASAAMFRGERIKILRASHRIDPSLPPSPPGAIVECNRAELVVATGSRDYITLEELQFPGKKRLPIREILRGKNFQLGERFENTD
jgi:methionyl-tRNA formyltransferase